MCFGRDELVDFGRRLRCRIDRFLGWLWQLLHLLGPATGHKVVAAIIVANTSKHR